MDSLAVNYIDTVNTDDGSCYYLPGCNNSSYLEYYTQGFTADYNNGDCQTEAIWGCTDSTAFNYDIIANIDNGGCIPVILGCMESLAFNFDPLANTPDTCVPLIYGCIDPTMFNFDVNANTDDGDCERVPRHSVPRRGDVDAVEEYVPAWAHGTSRGVSSDEPCAVGSRV